jgi:hypothetical protein
VRLFAGEPENMALSLNDLSLPLDTGAPQPGPRANAPANRPSDPFASLFDRSPAPAHSDANAAPPRNAAPARSPRPADSASPPDAKSTNTKSTASKPDACATL